MNTIYYKIRSVVSGLLVIAVLSACAPTISFAPTSTSTSTFTPTPTDPYPPTQTPQSTEMPLPSWAVDFSEPILFAIQDRPPDFQDDFSQPATEWAVSSGAGSDGTMIIENGVVNLDVEPNQSVIYIENKGINFKNFILQVDIDLKQLDSSYKAGILWGGGYEFALNPVDGWQLNYYVDPEYISLSSGNAPVDQSKLIEITIVSKGNEIAIYLNRIPLTYFKDIEKPSRTYIEIGLGGPLAVESESIAFDNFSIWNLDPFIPPLGDTLQPTTIPTPAAWIADFSAPLLYAIQDRPPDFQDDFSQPDTGWVFITGHGDGTVEIADGVMLMGAVSERNAVATHKKMTLYNFILQVDVTFLNLEDQISADIFWRQYDGIAEVFSLQNDGSWALKRYDRPDYPVFASGSEAVDLLKPVTITIVSRGTEFAVYLNNMPQAYHNDIGRPPSNGIQLQMLNLGDNKIDSAMAFDNLSVWNLDSILPPPIATPVPTATPHPLVAKFGDPILLAIQDRPPDFQDDFSKGSTGWITSPGGTVDIANGVLALSGGTGQGVENVKVPRTNFTNFVVKVEVNTQKLSSGCEATIQWRGGADGPGRIFGLSNGRWSFHSIYGSQDDLLFAAGMPTNGQLPLSATGVNTITLISRESEIAVYLNGEPITYVMDIDRPPDPGFYFGLWYPDFCIAEYDNLKVWNLDKLK